MPLFTDQIDLARVAYDALEKRTLSAESRATQLSAALAIAKGTALDIASLRQRIAELEKQNLELRNELNELKQADTDASLQQFIELIAMSAALGETTMPGRTVESLSASVKAHLSPMAGAEGVTLRFQPPELGAINIGAMSTTSFEIAKVPPAAGVTAPGNFYALLLDTQAIYAALNAPKAADLARRIVIAVSQAIADTHGWRFAYLVGVAASLADLQAQVAAMDERPQAGALRARCEDLSALAKRLAAKARPVAGDLYALTSAFSETTIAAGAFAELFRS